MNKIFNILSKILVGLVALFALLFSSCSFFRWRTSCGILNIPVYRDSNLEAPVSFVGEATGELKIINDDGWGKKFISIKVPQNLNDNISYTLPSEQGKANYVLTWQEGNLLQWKDINSVASGGTGELIQVVEKKEAPVEALKEPPVTNTDNNVSETGGSTTATCTNLICNVDRGKISLNSDVIGTLSLINGGIGSSLEAPGEDRILFWDESAGKVRWLKIGKNLNIKDRVLNAKSSKSGGGSDPIIVPPSVPSNGYTGEIYTAGNGLYVSGSEVRLGGALTENTTLSLGAYDMLYDLNGTGSFEIKNNGISSFYVSGLDGNVGIGTTAPKEHLTLAGGNFYHYAQGDPILAGSYNTDGDVRDVYISGNYAYVADGLGGLKIIDVSNPSSPSLISTYSTSGYASSLFVSGKYAYVAEGSSGLEIIDISNPYSPFLVGTNTTYEVYDIHISGKYAYLAAYNSGVVIFDISNPASPSPVGVYSFGNTLSIHVSGRYAYAGHRIFPHGGRLSIIDISNPLSPLLVGTYSGTRPPSGIDISGKYAYIAAEKDGLEIIDISNPSSPSYVGSFNEYPGASYSSYDVQVSGNYAYLASIEGEDGGGYLNVIDISDPSNPKRVGYYYANDYFSGFATSVFVSGKHAYLAEGGTGLLILDINGTETPTLNAGNIWTSDLTVVDSVGVGNNMYVKNGLNVGSGGFYSQGAASIMLGAGTSSPQTALSIYQLNSGDILNLFNNTGEVLTVTSGGNVGIGTTNPTQALDVVGNFQLSGAFMPGGDAGTSGYYLQSQGSGSAPVWVDLSSSLLPSGSEGQMLYNNNGTWTSTSQLFFNDTSNYLGIGTTAPDHELDVLGTIQAYNFINSAGMPVNDILLEKEVRNYSITALTGSLGLDMTSNFVEKVSETTFNTSRTYNPSAATLTNGNVLIAYSDGGSLNYGTFVIYDPSGNEVVSGTTFNEGITNSPSATTLTNGNILITYSDGGSSNSGNFVIYDSAGKVVKSETTFNAGATYNPSATTLTNGNVFIAYRDNDNSDYGNFVIYDSSGNEVVSETTFNAGATNNPSATTLTNGNILIAYSKGGSYSGNFVIYDSSGNEVVSETTFNSGTIYSPSATTLTNGNILIAYSEGGSYFGNVVIYDSAGNVVKSATTFNTGMTYNPSATTLTNGNVLIAYYDDDSFGASGGKFVIYDSVGNIVVSETTFNVGITNSPSATTLTNGNILIAYQDASSLRYGNFVIYGSSGASFANNIGIGTTAPTANLHVAGTLRFSDFGAGTLTTDADGNVSVSSDERLKNIQGSFNRGLAEILELDPILYKWNGGSGMETKTTYAGLSAQNVQSVIPEAVDVGPNGYLTLSDRPIIAATINAIKEQQNQIEELKSLIAGERKILESSQSGSSLNIQTTDTGILSQIQTVYEEFREMIQALGMTSHTDGSGDDYLSIDSDVKMAGDLNVLGDTTISNLMVTGDVRMGLITINTEENSIDVLGVSCYNEDTGEESEYCSDTIDDPSLSTLYLQKSSSGNLNIFNGKLVIKPNGTMKLDGNLKVSGSVSSESVDTKTVSAEKIILKNPSNKDSKTSSSEETSEHQVEGEGSLDLSEPCEKGEIKWDDNNIYVCTSSKKWKASHLKDVE